MRRIVLLAALLAAVPSALAAQAPPAAADKSPALALAEMVSPTDKLLEIEIATARKGFFGAAQQDASFKAVEKDHPGLTQAVWSAIEPELRRMSVADAPKLQARIAAVYAARLSAGEQQTLLTFYATPTGQKLIRSMYAGMDAEPIVAAAMKNPDAPVSASAMAAATDAAKRKAVAALDASDQGPLEALGRAIPLPKLLAVGEEVQRTTLAWINEDDPAVDARMQAIVEEAVMRHIGGGAKPH